MILIGHSMGGLVVLSAAQQLRDTVKAIIAVDTFSPPEVALASFRNLFSFEGPLARLEVPEEVLELSNSWGNKDVYWQKFNALATRLIENFKFFADGTGEDVKKAAPLRLKTYFFLRKRCADRLFLSSLLFFNPFLGLIQYLLKIIDKFIYYH